MKNRYLIFLVIIVISLTFALGVMIPIPKFWDFPFFKYNLTFGFLFLFFTMTMFLYKYTPLAYGSIILKGLIPVASVPLIFFLIGAVNHVQTYIDEESYEALLSHVSMVSTPKSKRLTHYIRTELVFLGVASIISCFAFVVRTAISIWRNKNRGTA